MKVLVTGGTGFIGTHLCRELHERGHDVTALSRTPGDADLPDGVETAIGDVTAPDSIDEAFVGQDAVVNLVSLSPLFKPPGGLSHREVHLEGTRNVVDAAEHHGLRKIVQMSALGADPNGPTAYIRAKGKAEQVVRTSTLAWTVVRPSVVFGDGGEFVSFTKLLTTPYVTALPGGGMTRFQPIWVGDLVPILADCLLPTHDSETLELGGPEVLTLADVTKLVYRAEGKSVTVLPMPMLVAGFGLSLADPIPFVPLGTDQFKSLSFDNTVVENDVSTFGIESEDLLTFEAHLGLEADHTSSRR